jgi:hypothetical protein
MLILIGLTFLAFLALASLGKAATPGAPQFLIKEPLLKTEWVTEGL